MRLRHGIALALALSACGRINYEILIDGGSSDATVLSDAGMPMDAAVDASTTDAGPIAIPGSDLLLEIDPGERLEAFPILVVLDDVRAARDLMEPDASDLRFYDADHTLLPHEIERVGIPGGLPLIAWVRVPVIEGTATRITIEYGQASPPPVSTESVWAPPFVGVWHLVDLHDSTPFQNDGTWMGGPMTNANGMAGPALSFVVADRDVIVVADDASLGFTRALTVTGWVNPRSLSPGLGYSSIVSRQNGGATNDDFWLGINNPSTSAEAVVSLTTQLQVGVLAQPVPLNEWSHLTLTYDGSWERLYVDAIEVDTAMRAGDILHEARPVLIGADHNTPTGIADADFMDGLLDEVRLENVARSPAWIRYDDLSVRDQLLTYGAVRR